MGYSIIFSFAWFGKNYTINLDNLISSGVYLIKLECSAIKEEILSDLLLIYLVIKKE